MENISIPCAVSHPGEKTLQENAIINGMLMKFQCHSNAFRAHPEESHTKHILTCLYTWRTKQQNINSTSVCKELEYHSPET
ncbi:hypothetical protein Nmel_017331 [Mimus melanotis]